MTPSTVLRVLACASFSMACGGRSIDLQQAAGGAGGAGGAASVDHSASKVLDERIYDFWVDDTRLYWQTETNALRGCLQSDCAHTTLSYGSSATGSVGVGSDDIYWLPGNTQRSVILSCPKKGCAGAPRTALRDPNGIFSMLAADEDYFYWSSPFDIYRCPKAGCGATPEVVATSQTGLLSFQGENVYWQAREINDPTDAGVSEGNSATESSPRILRAPKNGAEPPRELRLGDSADQSQGGIQFSFALDSKQVYWIDPSGAVLSCPLQGCTSGTPAKLANIDPSGNNLRVDDAGLYWLESGEGTCGEGRTVGGSLHFCAFADCASKDSSVLVTRFVNDYALSGPYVYFTERLADNCYPRNIQRIPKPTQ